MSHLDRAQRQLEISTDKSESEALACARAAVEAIGSVGTTRVRVTEQANGGFRVALKPTVVGIAHGAGYFDVLVDKGLHDETKTDLLVMFSEPVVTQSKLLGFIPMGPKSVMGLSAYERALKDIEAALRR